jgi:hypothetical protein
MNPKAEQYRPLHGGYVSEFEQFLSTYLQRHPEVERDQRRGWDIWWDHRVDLDELDRQRKDTVPVKTYRDE